MRWQVKESPAPDVERLCRDLRVSRFLAGLLAGRGHTDPAAAARFLAPRLQLFENPLGLEGVDRAATRICQALKGGEDVLVYGDYDVDGITSVCLLLSFFRDLGFPASYMVPTREDGYGLTMPYAERIAAVGHDLVITVDCGTASREEVAYLNARGIDVIVTDHHQVHAAVPDALAFINPMSWEDEPEYAVLSGVGVAFLLVMGTWLKLKEDPKLGPRLPALKSYLDIVTLGTVADMVPLTGPNRALVATGLKLMGTTPTRPGVVALKDVCGLADRRIDTGSIAFQMGPRLNAAGRVSSAESAVRLLLAQSYPEARAMAEELSRLNQERRELEAAILAEADSLLSRVAAGGELLAGVLYSPAWHRGVLGIVASRLVERYFRPVVLLTGDGEGEGTAVGSARSIPGFDIGGALDRCRDLLVRSGGHSLAAGLTIEVARIDDLRQSLERLVAQSVPAEALQPTLRVDAVVPLSEVGSEMLVDLERLAPFGNGNPEPLIAVRDVTVKSRSVVGGEHLKLMVEQGGRKVEAMFWRHGSDPVAVGDRVDLAFVPEMRTWQGVTSLQLSVRDLVRTPWQ